MSNKYEISNGDLFELAALLPLKEIEERYKDYLPGERQLRRRLARFGRIKPDTNRKHIRRLCVLATMKELSVSEAEAEQIVDKEIAARLKALDAQIQEKIKEYEKRFNEHEHMGS